jgi:hypothetical protein
MVFAGLASKPVATVCEWFGLKTTRTIFCWFGLKTSDDSFLQLGSKLVSTVSPGSASKSTVSFLVEPQN